MLITIIIASCNIFFNIGVCSLGTENLMIDNKTLCINNFYPFILYIVDYRQRWTTYYERLLAVKHV